MNQFPEHEKLRYAKIRDYVPEWRRDNKADADDAEADEAPVPPAAPAAPEAESVQLDIFSAVYGDARPEPPAAEPYHADAIDVMLDLTDRRVVSVEGGRSLYKLRFLSEHENKLGRFAVIALHGRSAKKVNESLSGIPAGHTVVFLLHDALQKDRIKTSLPHCFAIRDGGRYRYFGKG